MFEGRGVHYVHCVIHKCNIVKIGGKRKVNKVCKKHVNFTKSGKICISRGNNNFPEIGGNILKQRK